MARRKRIQAAGHIYHVMARGNGRAAIFLDSTDYRHFVELLAEAVEEYDLVCWNYCALVNHFHATLQPTRANLSSAMQKLNSAYATWWNRRHDRVGHLLQGRYKHQIVQHGRYLLVLSRYVVMNPVRAHLVRHPREWPWSSYRATMGLVEAPPFLSVSSTLALFGGPGDNDAPARFEQFVTSPPEDDDAVRRLRSPERVVGDRDFKRTIKALSGERGAAAGLAGAEGPRAAGECAVLPPLRIGPSVLREG